MPFVRPDRAKIEGFIYSNIYFLVVAIIWHLRGSKIIVDFLNPDFFNKLFKFSGVL